MVTVTLYTTPTCPWCVRTKEFLKKKKVKYTELNVVEDENAREAMVKKSGQMGVPVIDIDGTIIVGFDEAALEKLLGKK
ncbi:MAG: glutaredoxin domain-containing protein [Nanoarchaeota archaeon]